MKKTLLMAATAALITAGGSAWAGHHEGDGEHKRGHGGMMEKMDTNEDGMISKDEFLAKHAAHFDKMDKDGDGNISKDEMSAAREQMKEKMGERREKRHDKRKKRRSHSDNDRYQD